MAQTYANASVVLVLDEGIRQIYATDSILEKMFIIFVSTWVQRLWPLQEMLLGEQMVFRISDGFMDYREFATDEAVSLAQKDVVATELLGWFAQALIFKLTKTVSLEAIIWHLSRRTSSRRPDETLAIAGLFGLDASEYVDLDPAERMFKFLIEHNGCTVPSDIIFLLGDKLEGPGRCWAPRSFMMNSQTSLLKGNARNQTSVITEHGLLGNYLCLVLEQVWPSLNIPGDFLLSIEETGEQFIIMLGTIIRPSDRNAIDVLILGQDVKASEEYLAVAATQQGFVIEEGENILLAGVGHLIHVWKEQAKGGIWSDLPSIVGHRQEMLVLLKDFALGK